MKNRKYIKYIGLAIIILLLPALAGFGCRKPNVLKSESYSIKMWGVFDNSNEVAPFIKSYQNQYPNVRISYEKKSFDDYEKVLLNELATGEGPDIFVMHNTWLPKYQDKITPAPTSIYPIQEFRDRFVAVAEDDLVADDQIYALPLYIDTLAMYYNFDDYRVTKEGKPSKTWEGFYEDVKRLNVYEENSKILKRSAVALGTAHNVNQAVDVIYQLFLQNDVNFYNSKGLVSFASDEGNLAFANYLSFADPKSTHYAWQDTRPDDIYEFVNGRVSTIVGYSYLYDQIVAESRTKGIDFRIAKMPQVDPEKPVTYADYWAYTAKKMDATKDSARINHVWNFLKMMTLESGAKSYHDMTKRPSAIRSLLEEQEKEADFGIFANQVRYASSIKNYDRNEYNDIFDEAIDKVIKEGEKPLNALREASKKVSKIVSAYN